MGYAVGYNTILSSCQPNRIAKYVWQYIQLNLVGQMAGFQCDSVNRSAKKNDFETESNRIQSFIVKYKDLVWHITITTININREKKTLLDA